MKIQTVTIKKFRSIKEAVIRMHDITAIVGENNAGKTAVLRAINAVMNFKEEENNFLNDNHRFAPRSNTHIQITFEDVPLDFADKIHDGKMIIEFNYTYSKHKKQFSYLNDSGDNINLDDSFLSKLANEIIYVYIPADRTNNDTFWQDGAIFKKLVSSYCAQHTKQRDTITPHVRKATENIHSLALKNLEKKINSLYLQNKDVDFNVDFPSDLDYNFLLSYVVLSMNEHGHNYLLKEWGSGTKSLAIIAMHRANALLKETSIVLGIEEPEVNLHPQAQRRFIISLRGNRHQNETQSIFTTHSTVLVDSLRHEDIVLVHRKNDPRGFISEITQLPDDFWKKNNIEDFRHYQFFNYKNSDFFFAKFVVISESKNDSQVFENLITPMIGNIASDVSYLDAGGKCNIQYPYFLLKELNIPFVLVVDKDFFFPYAKDNLEQSRDKTGLPLYSDNMNNNLVLDNLFSNNNLRQEIEEANKRGYRAFFDKIKNYNILSMNYCLEMDLTCSSQARTKYYNLLKIKPSEQTQVTLLKEYNNAIKKIGNIFNVLEELPSRSLPESYQKIKNHIESMIKSMSIA